jgi:hypothetical protein
MIVEQFKQTIALEKIKDRSNLLCKKSLENKLNTSNKCQ